MQAHFDSFTIQAHFTKKYFFLLACLVCLPKSVKKFFPPMTVKKSLSRSKKKVTHPMDYPMDHLSIYWGGLKMKLKKILFSRFLKFILILFSKE